MAKKPKDGGSGPGAGADGSDKKDEIVALVVTLERDPKYEMIPIKLGSKDHDALNDVVHDLLFTTDVGLGIFAGMVNARDLISEDGEEPKCMAVLKIYRCSEFLMGINFKLFRRLSFSAQKELFKYELLRIPYGHFTSYHKSLRTRYGPALTQIAERIVLSQLVNSALLAEENVVLPVPEMWDLPRGLTTDQYCELLADKGHGNVPSMVRMTVLRDSDGEPVKAGSGGNPDLTPAQREELKDLLDAMKDELGLTKMDGESGVDEQDGQAMDLATRQFLQQADNQLKARNTSLKQQGFMAGEASQLIEALEKPTLLKWRSYVRRMHDVYIGDNRIPSSRRFSRRAPITPLADGSYIKFYQGSKRAPQPYVLFVVDTSGSMGEMEIASVRAQLVELINIGTKVLVLQVDAGVACEPIEFSKHHKLNEWFGRGGTDFRPAFEHAAIMNPRPSYLVYFTDGYGTAPDPDPGIPTLWVLTSTGYSVDKFRESVCAWGDAVTLEIEDAS